MMTLPTVYSSLPTDPKDIRAEMKYQKKNDFLKSMNSKGIQKNN
jgi:hypothetical protein